MIGPQTAGVTNGRAVTIKPRRIETATNPRSGRSSFRLRTTYPQATLRGTGGPPRLPPGPPIITAPGGGPPARPSGS